MSDHTIQTLLELLDQFKVEIPIVQRDYAQGRADDHAQLVRKNIIKDLKAALLKETPPLDLNFVYGKAEEGLFIPLDGQQRLTTLFLLHLYAYAEDDSKTDILKRFTYKTRKSSRDFLEKLTENRDEVFKSDLCPSKEIKDSQWFVTAWEQDPTVKSVLTMLDEIKSGFADVPDLSTRLSDETLKPIVFNFLNIDDLGMEDSLYIKLNARGKPLTSFENFKARLVGRMQELSLSFAGTFEKKFDGSWTDLFWDHDKSRFDQTYLNFFGVLFRNRSICGADDNWSNTLNYEKIDQAAFETAFYTLCFLTEHVEHMEISNLIFKAVSDKGTYPDRVVFHAVTTYLYKTKGKADQSFGQWIRIIKNLVYNSTLDNEAVYKNAIQGIDKIADEYNGLLEYMSQKGIVSGFSQEQIREEQIKAQVILKDSEFAEKIYAAEQHPYFSGQIRAALYYSENNQGSYEKDIFSEYWDKIAMLFDSSAPKYGNLLRQALLTFGDYTLPVASYKTLCVDDPNEAASTPSLKRLFSSNSPFVKQLLDALTTDKDVCQQLKDIVTNAVIPQNDWRYCFIKYDLLFKKMSSSHLRLRQVEDNIIIIPNKSSSGINYEPFLEVLQIELEKNSIPVTFCWDYGAAADRYLDVDSNFIFFDHGRFTITNTDIKVLFETKSDKPIDEILHYILKHQ